MNWRMGYQQVWCFENNNKPVGVAILRDKRPQHLEGVPNRRHGTEPFPAFTIL